MEYNYLIVLFKNKVKKKIINKFQTLPKAEEKFNELIKTSNNVLFEKKYENGSPCNYEIGIITRSSGLTENIYIRDEIGRQKKLEIEGNHYSFIKISNYKIEDKILDVSKNSKISCEQFIKKYLPKGNMSMVSSLNNKVVVQNDDDVNLFTFKTISESSRFIDFLFGYFLSQKRNETLFVKDISTAQRKYLYRLLEEKGFSKSYLRRQSTTHPSKK